MEIILNNLTKQILEILKGQLSVFIFKYIV